MIKTIEIHGYKALHNVKVQNAQRINILVGQNGSGKTAFLESLFALAAQSPEVFNRFRGWRGKDGEYTGDRQGVIDSLFSGIFPNPNDTEATLSATDTHGVTRSCKIKKNSGDQLVDVSSKIGEQDSTVTSSFEFTYLEDDETVSTVSPELVDGQLKLRGVRESPISVNFIPARVNISERETARIYSKMRIDGLARPFEQALCDEFPIINSLMIEAPYGYPTIYAELKTPNSRMLPLTDLSGGISHVAGIMLRIAAQPNSLILIDEIENGVFHTQYKSIWSSLNRLAEKQGCQIFATTHSVECLEALADAMRDSPEHVRFFRSKLTDEGVAIDEMSGNTLFKALQFGDPR